MEIRKSIENRKKREGKKEQASNKNMKQRIN